MKRKKSSVAGRHHFSEQEIISALEQFTRAGNISVKEFTTAFQISPATFYNWRKRFGSQPSEVNVPVGFIDVDPNSLVYNGPVFWEEVRSSNRFFIHWYSSNDCLYY